MAERRPPARAVAALGGLVLLLAPGSAGTYAGWTTSEPFTGVTLTTGDLDLDVDGNDTLSGIAGLDLSSVLPGDSVATVLRVDNNGNVPLTYHLDAATTNPDGLGLGSALQVKVTGDSSTTGAAPAETCPGSALAGSGTSLTQDLLGSAGSPRSLSPGGSETICVQVRLPLTAPLGLLGASTDVTLTFQGRAAGSWTDDVEVTGIGLDAAGDDAPTASCGVLNLGSTTVQWTSVPGATGYRLSYGVGGATTENVPAGTTTKTFTGTTAGTFSVKAVLGGSGWVSGSSNTLAYTSVLAGIGTCA